MNEQFLHKCPKCGIGADWKLFNTKEEMKQFHEDGICFPCKYPKGRKQVPIPKIKQVAIPKRRRHTETI